MGMTDWRKISALADHAARYHGDTEITSVDTDRTITRTNWRGINARARQLASALTKLGLDPQARVAVWELVSSLRDQGMAVVEFVIFDIVFVQRATWSDQSDRFKRTAYLGGAA